MCTRTCKLKIYQTMGYTAGLAVGLTGVALNFMFAANDPVQQNYQPQQQSPYLVSVQAAAMKMYMTFNDLNAIEYDGHDNILSGGNLWQIQGGTDNLGNQLSVDEVINFLVGMAGEGTDHLHAE